ncbi:MAG: IPT/TIG domain-containing protein [Bacteroidota bacterium]
MSTSGRFLLCCLLLTALIGCKKTEKKTPPAVQVQPRDTLYVTMTAITDINAGGATFHARITKSGNANIIEHGFAWSDSVLLPTLADAKRSFTATPDTAYSFRVTYDLYKQHHYHVRAYLKTDTSLLYSNLLSFTSLGCLPPAITVLLPDSACGGRTILVTGSNFSPKASRNKVFVGSTPASIIKSANDSLWILVPMTPVTRQVSISVTTAGQQGTSPGPFKWISPWDDLPLFPGEARFGNASFMIGSKGYLCLGMTGMNSFASPLLWEYNMVTNSWQTKQQFPAPSRNNAIGFSINGMGYMGLGEDASYLQFRDLWQYDPAADAWLQKSSFPGNLTSYIPGVAWFVLNNKLYLYSPCDVSFWEYDPAADHWSAMPLNKTFTGKWISEGFTWNNRGFFIQLATSGSGNGAVLWEYDPAASLVSRADSIGTGYSWINHGSFILQNKLHLPLRGNQLLEYDLISKTGFYHDSPVDQEDFNAVFLLPGRAFLGKSESNSFYRFYPR